MWAEEIMAAQDTATRLVTEAQGISSSVYCNGENHGNGIPLSTVIETYLKFRPTIDCDFRCDCRVSGFNVSHAIFTN